MGQPALRRWPHWPRCARVRDCHRRSAEEHSGAVAGVAPELMLAPLREGRREQYRWGIFLRMEAPMDCSRLLKAKKISVVPWGRGFRLGEKPQSLFAALLPIAACRW